MKHINVALFVPDEGCPHRCSFCNQKTISGKCNKLTVDEIDAAVSIAIRNADHNEGEIAFFGGSFTGIEREYMLSLLERAKLYVDKGLFKGIRISTRPDYISKEILDILSKYSVTSIELGCQSLNDDVLRLNRRGHSCEDVVKAAQLIKNYGFELGVQLMTGLYGDDDESCTKSAEKLIALEPDTARIYPTVVLEGTHLFELYKKGEYKPQTLSEAVVLCSRIMMMFEEKNIRVIRVGLHSGGNVESGYAAGAYHPAIRELCESEIYFTKILNALAENNISEGNINIVVGSKYVSMATGQKKTNINRLNKMGIKARIVQNNDYTKYQVSVRLAE